jgi:hypothetical protein
VFSLIISLLIIVVELPTTFLSIIVGYIVILIGFVSVEDELKGKNTIDNKNIKRRADI